MRFLLAIFLIVLGLLPIQVSALEISYSSLNPFDGSASDTEAVLLHGEINPGDYDRLLRLIAKNPTRFSRSNGFILASRGGDIREALKIARLVKGTYSSVFVGEAAGPCVSACFFIYAAAARREAGSGLVGIHRPYIEPRYLQSLSAHQAERTQKDVLQKARSYLEYLDVPTNLIDKMFQRASTEIYWLSRDELDVQMGRRPPWFEQFLIAKCGLDKSIEQRYFATNDETLRGQLFAVDDCGTRVSNPEAEGFLQAALKTAARR